MMENSHTKVTEPFEIKEKGQIMNNLTPEKLQKIMTLLLKETGAIEARSVMHLSVEIADIKFYQLVKEHELYLYWPDMDKELSSWVDFCEQVIGLEAEEVNEAIKYLPQRIAKLKELITKSSAAPNLLDGFLVNINALKELV